MHYDLGPANHHAELCISRTRWLPSDLKDLLHKEGIWDDLTQELYTAAFWAWKLGMDDVETRRYAGRHLYAFLKAYGFRPYNRGYFKHEKPFSAVFNFNIADKGLAPRDGPYFVCQKQDDHLDEEILALLKKHPEGLPKRNLSGSFQLPLYEINRYLARMIKQGIVAVIKRENIRGRPLSPLLVAIEPGQTLPEPRMVKTEQIEHIRQVYFVEGKSIKQIAREEHHCRRTVRRVIRESKLEAVASV